MDAVSVIVPTLNEVDNIALLVKRIHASLAHSGLLYEIIFIDDHSTDGTKAAVEQMARQYPIIFKLKLGERGKAFSLLEGFATAHYDYLCMIDADLQYPPEDIVSMYRLLKATNTDIVLTNRQNHGTTKLRKITSSGFNYIFTKKLFGFDYDSQSGLKLFRRQVIDSIKLSPTPWSFDLEFIVRSLERGYKIVSHNIIFSERYSGEAKVKVFKAAKELAKASIKLRFTTSPSKLKKANEANKLNARRWITASVLAIIVSSLLALSPVSPVAAVVLLPVDYNSTSTPINNEPSLPLAETIPTDPKAVASNVVTPLPTDPTSATTTPGTTSPSLLPSSSTPTDTPSGSVGAGPLPVSADTNPVVTVVQQSSVAPKVTTTPQEPLTTTSKVMSNLLIQMIKQPSLQASSRSTYTPSTLAVSQEPTAFNQLSLDIPFKKSTIRYPALAKKDPTFLYKAPTANRLTQFIRPLSLASAAMAIIGLLYYSVSTNKQRYTIVSPQYRSSRIFEG